MAVFQRNKVPAGGDPQPRTEAPDTRPAEPYAMRHYLYFATEGAAGEATDTLGAEGFTVQMGPFENSWIAHVSHLAVLSAESIGALCGRLHSLATSLGGEYDGWEPTARA